MTDLRTDALITELETPTGMVKHQVPSGDLIEHRVDLTGECLCGPNDFHFRTKEEPPRTFDVYYHWSLAQDHVLSRYRSERSTHDD